MRLADELHLDLDAAASRPSRVPSLNVAELQIPKSLGHLPNLEFSFGDIACLLGVTRQAVQHTEAKALRRLAEVAELEAAWQAIGADQDAAA